MVLPSSNQKEHRGEQSPQLARDFGFQVGHTSVRNLLGSQRRTSIFPHEHRPFGREAPEDIRSLQGHQSNAVSQPECLTQIKNPQTFTKDVFHAGFDKDRHRIEANGLSAGRYKAHKGRQGTHFSVPQWRTAESPRQIAKVPKHWLITAQKRKYFAICVFNMD